MALPALSAESARAKLAAAIPLLRGENVRVDLPAFSFRWAAVCTAVMRHQNLEGGKSLQRALARGDSDSTRAPGRLEPVEMLASVLAGRPEDIHHRADALGLDAGLTTAVLGLVLLPSLSQARAALAPFRQGAVWEHGYCPICGSWPLLGEYRGLEQTRFLRCGLCAAEWEFPRSLCVFCSERDHRHLGYFGVEGEEARYRAATCETCRSYVKMAATLAPLSLPELLVANVATLHLDLAAADRGYASPPVLAEPDT
jgi:FdhE protein